jgi:hypothetical protein
MRPLSRSFVRRLRLCDTEITADLVCEKLVDFTMTWNGRSLVVGRIVVYGVFPAFAEQLAAMRFQVLN